MKKFFIILSIFILTLTAVQANEVKQVCVNHILVPTEMDAIKLKSQIKTFEDFQYYAKLYSSCPSGQNGGSLGCFGRGQMVKPFEDAAFNGLTNQVSDPVKTQFGYHLLWISGKF